MVSHQTEASAKRSAISRAVTSCIAASATDARPSVSSTSSPSPPSGKYVARTPVSDNGGFSQWKPMPSSSGPQSNR